MSSILTNARAAQQMSDLEIRARKGDVAAQDEMQKRCMQFANVVMSDVKAGADMVDRNSLMK